MCGAKTMSYSLSVTMHVWTLRSPRFAARWNETAATLLFCHPTHAKHLETSEPSDLAGKTEREHAMSAFLTGPTRHELLDKKQGTATVLARVVDPRLVSIPLSKRWQA